jgi:hypothetical protein
MFKKYIKYQRIMILIGGLNNDIITSEQELDAEIVPILVQDCVYLSQKQKVFNAHEEGGISIQDTSSRKQKIPKSLDKEHCCENCLQRCLEIFVSLYSPTKKLN